MASRELANANITRNNLFYQQRRLVKYIRAMAAHADKAQGGTVSGRREAQIKAPYYWFM